MSLEHRTVSPSRYTLTRTSGRSMLQRIPKAKIFFAVVLTFMILITVGAVVLLEPIERAESCDHNRISQSRCCWIAAPAREDAVSLPEYHATLFGRKAVAAFQQDWMNAARVTSYSHSRHDATKTGNYVIETGVSTTVFDFGAKSVNYKGSIWLYGGLSLMVFSS